MSVVSLPKKPPRRDELPIGSDLAQLVGRQDRVVADVVDLVLARHERRCVRAAQDHVGGGAGGRRRGREDRGGMIRMLVVLEPKLAVARSRTRSSSKSPITTPPGEETPTAKVTVRRRERTRAIVEE